MMNRPSEWFTDECAFEVIEYMDWCEAEIQQQAEQIERLEKALKFADYLIGKLAGWNGIDLSTLDEEYPEYKTINQALAAPPQKGE